MKRRRFKTPLKRREKHRKDNRRYSDTPKGSYSQARRNAARRGIEWAFDFESWWRLWELSCHWPMRGRRVGAYCMARLGDTGPYAAWNCEIVLISVNAQAAAVSAGIVNPASVPDARKYSRNYCEIA